MEGEATRQLPQHADAMEDVLPATQEPTSPQQPTQTAVMQSSGTTTLKSLGHSSPQSSDTPTNDTESQFTTSTTSHSPKSASPQPSNTTSHNTGEQLSDSTTHSPVPTPPQSPVPTPGSLEVQAAKSSTPQPEKSAPARTPEIASKAADPSSEVKPQEPDTSIATESKPVKSEKMMVAKCSDLFVSQDDTDASTPVSGLKRLKSEVEDEKKPIRVKIRDRKKARVNPDMVPPYDDTAEKANSQFAIDQPCFAETEQLVSTIGDMVLQELEALAGEGYEEPELEIRKQKLKRAVSPAQRLVPSWHTGIVGDTGCGKSSLNNSLLNEQNATAEGDSGSVGTHVVTEFAMEDPSSNARFRSIVWYHTNSQIDGLVKGHFAAIYDWENMCEKDRAGLDADEDEKYKNDCKMGCEFFETLLCGADSCPRMESTDAVRQYIGTAKSAADKTKIEALRNAVQAYLTSLNRDGGATTLYADDKAEIIKKMAKYAGRNPGDTQPSPWPLVRNITAYRADPRILSGGMVLADLPGLSDTNSGRANAAKQYAKRCRTLVIAHDLLRILTHPNVAKLIRDAWRSGQIEDIVVVATKSDNIDHSKNRATSKEDSEMIEKLRKEAKDLKEEADSLAADSTAALEDDEYDLCKELKQEAAVKERAAIAAKQSLHELNITLRNQDITAQMQKLIQSLTGSATPTNVPLFCVSNSIYQVHRQGYECKSPPDLSVMATQIPDLRDHLYRAPAEKKLQNLVKVCKVEDEAKKAGRKRLLAKVREAQLLLGTQLMPKLAECEKFD